MTKYTEKQKLDAVLAYRKGNSGLRATAEAQGVHVDSLRKWLAAYDALGAAGIVRKKRSNYHLDFKLDVLRRIREEGISCRQAAALFDVRRPDQIAEWKRLYDEHGEVALRAGWKHEQKQMSKTPRHRQVDEAQADDQRSREQLLKDVQELRLENAYLKKAQALARAKKLSVPAKGR